MTIGVFAGFLGAGFLVWILSYIIKTSKYKNRFRDIIQKAKLESQNIFQIAKESSEKYKEELESDLEREKDEIHHRMKLLQEKIKEKELDFNENYKLKNNTLSEKHHSFKKYEKKVLEKQDQLIQEKRREEDLKEKLIQELKLKTKEDLNDLQKDLIQKILSDEKTRWEKWVNRYEEEIQSEVERKAKKILRIALLRFLRPYCPERGLKHTQLKNNKEKKAVIGKNKEQIPMIEKACGIDIIYNEKTETLSIAGFDPVRRELGRLVLEKLLKGKKSSHGKSHFSRQIQSIVKKAKKELIQKIRRDGYAITKELGVEDLNENVKNMMGALRYRYSFTQNQHFHCGEVGFLTGLLSSELRLPVKKGRKAGLLHDIGKAMDHSMEGGHAVIGADYIQKYGVNDDIVHAVRAHHYDEHPRTDLAYLVIAADALSGARPGARHSTVETYTQKVDQLQNIGNSFEGVIDTYILSAGREVRVFVDSDKITDFKALDLSRDIAKEIETKCFYPGQIKVTVVRKKVAIEMAR